MTPQEQRNKRFDEKFNNRLGFCFECCEAETLITDVKSHITSEVNLTIEQVERWAEKEIFYIDSQLKTEKDDFVIEYITGKKNIANDLLAFLKDLKK